MTFDPPVLGVQPYGASIGSKSLFITITSGAEPSESLKTVVKQTLTDDEYKSMLIGETQIVFKGTSTYDPANPEVRQQILDFVEELSPESLEYQVQVLGRKDRQLRPPFLVLNTTGKFFTGQDEFYENFNYITAEIALQNSVAGTGKDATTRYNPFALIELSKHPFATFVFRVADESDWAEVETELITTQYISCLRARLIALPDDAPDFETYVVYLQEAKKIALKYGVRAGADLSVFK